MGTYRRTTTDRPCLVCEGPTRSRLQVCTINPECMAEYHRLHQGTVAVTGPCEICRRSTRSRFGVCGASVTAPARCREEYFRRLRASPKQLGLGEG